MLTRRVIKKKIYFFIICHCKFLVSLENILFKMLAAHSKETTYFWFITLLRNSWVNCEYYFFTEYINKTKILLKPKRYFRFNKILFRNWQNCSFYKCLLFFINSKLSKLLSTLITSTLIVLVPKHVRTVDRHPCC